MIEQLKQKIKEFPPIKKYRIWRYDNKFEHDCYSCFRGVFTTFQEAYNTAPQNSKLGFDFPETADLFTERLSTINSYDYPVIYWLSSVIQDNPIVFDLGGNIGIHYYAYKDYLTYPENLKWIVCEVPKIVKIGREKSTAAHMNQLHFTEDIEHTDNCDVFLSAGTLQYFEKPVFIEAIAQSANKPKHILLNKLPLYEGSTFVTLQNARHTFTPQYVFNRNSFIEKFKEIGYEVIDEWRVYELKCFIPFFPDHSVSHYSGLYLRLRK